MWKILELFFENFEKFKRKILKQMAKSVVAILMELF